MTNLKVWNLSSPKSGRPVENQFCINNGGVYYFQSYDSICAIYYYNAEKRQRVLKLGCYWDYSRTTLKYLREWGLEIGCNLTSLSSAEIRKAIKEGRIEYEEDLY